MNILRKKTEYQPKRGSFDYLLETPPPPREPERPQRVTVNLEIFHPPKPPLPRPSALTVFVAAILLILLLVRAGHARDNGTIRYEHWTDSTTGSHGQITRQGRTTDSVTYGPNGQSKHCHRYFVGDQPYTTCN